jgi:hypothetical protein
MCYGKPYWRQRAGWSPARGELSWKSWGVSRDSRNSPWADSESPLWLKAVLHFGGQQDSIWAVFHLGGQALSSRGGSRTLGIFSVCGALVAGEAHGHDMALVDHIGTDLALRALDQLLDLLEERVDDLWSRRALEGIASAVADGHVAGLSPASGLSPSRPSPLRVLTLHRKFHIRKIYLHI